MCSLIDLFKSPCSGYSGAALMWDSIPFGIKIRISCDVVWDTVLPLFVMFFLSHIDLQDIYNSF